MFNLFWIGVQEVQKTGGDVQSAAPSAQEALQVIETFKSIASALHMDVWWLTLVVFSFVWGLRGFLKFVNVDMKSAPKIGPFSFSPGWWPALRNWLWRGIAVTFSCCVCCFAQGVAPTSLPDAHWIVLGPTYGIGAVILYHVLDYMGIMAKLGGKKK